MAIYAVTEKDFIFNRVEENEGHIDYWFDTTPDSDEKLLREYGEMGCEHVFEVVYSVDEDVVGIKRQFRFNWDVVLSKDENLKNFFRSLVTKIKSIEKINTLE